MTQECCLRFGPGRHSLHCPESSSILATCQSCLLQLHVYYLIAPGFFCLEVTCLVLHFLSQLYCEG